MRQRQIWGKGLVLERVCPRIDGWFPLEAPWKESAWLAGVAFHAKNAWTFLISATPRPTALCIPTFIFSFCILQSYVFTCLFDRKLNASTSNNRELRECFDWKTKLNLKILWPALAACSLGVGNQIDVETGCSGVQKWWPMFALSTGHNGGKWPVPGSKAGVVQEYSVVSAHALHKCACLAIISYTDAMYFSFHSCVHSDRNSLKHWTPALWHTVGRTKWPARILCFKLHLNPGSSL